MTEQDIARVSRRLRKLGVPKGNIERHIQGVIAAEMARQRARDERQQRQDMRRGGEFYVSKLQRYGDGR